MHKLLALVCCLGRILEEKDMERESEGEKQRDPLADSTHFTAMVSLCDISNHIYRKFLIIINTLAR